MESIYADISARTGGNIYIGVVGPVRTGKSTLVKRIMEVLVIPGIQDPYRAERARDELPQSGSGKTIMTAEPKFVPEEAAEIQLDGGAVCSVRLIDCVGYLVDGAVAPVWQTLRLGDDPEYAGMRGEVLALRHAGVLHEASGVWYLPNRPDKADTGFISLGEDTFYAATNAKLEDKQTGTVRLLHLNRQDYSFAPVNGIEN